MKRALVLLAITALGLSAQAIRTNPAFRANSIPRNDDGSGPLTPLGFTINFFGKQRTHGYVNNNGNITFDSALSTYTPFGLEGTRREIVAAFFADVDTRPAGSTLVTYGQDTVDGRRAFAANYVDVGYYNNHADKLNRFQIVLIERPDTGTGNFDLEFNYERIVWETGDASGGVGGFGGVPASVGWSNGSGEPGTSYELDGSLVPGSFLDSSRYSLVRNRLNANIAGRYVFRARSGQLLPPLTMVTSCPLPPAIAGQRYLTAIATVGGGPVRRFSMEADPGGSLPAGLTFSSDGVLTGVPVTSGESEFTLRVTSTTENVEEVAVRRCSLRTVAPSLDITTACPLPAATAGQAYRRTLVASGGRAPWQWDLADGSLPAGLALDVSGVISGVPTTSGTVNLLLRARSNELDRAEPAVKFCSLTVARPVQAVSNAACTLPAGTSGVPYTAQLSAPDTSGPLTWSALDPLPAGMTLDATGRLEGIPGPAGSASFRVRSRDASGGTAEQRCSLAVNEPSLRSTTACPLPMAPMGEAFQATFTAAGGDGSYTWSPIGALPPGLTLSANGVLLGYPAAAGNFGFRLLVSDSGGRAAATGCNLTVARPSFYVTSCPLPDGAVGVEYSRRLTAEGGTAPIVFSAAGSLPAGLTLSSGGLVSGRPSEAGAVSIPIRITDARGHSVQQSCAINVQASPIRIAGQCPLPEGTVGAGFVARFQASGGSPPYRFTLNGALPSGLTLSSDGAISGIPLSAGSSQFLIEARDAADRWAGLRCSAEVSLPDPPVVRISAVPAQFRPASAGPEVAVELSRPYSLPVEGQIVLDVEADTGSPDATINRSDPAVRFATGERTWSFRIAPGATRATNLIPSTGTVASTVTIKAAQAKAGGSALRSLPSPRQFRISRTVPVLTDACYTAAGAGIEIRADGYSTTRRIETAVLTRAGQSEPVRILMAGTSDSWFGGDQAVRTGGGFSVTFPVAVAAAEWSLSLTNSEGASAPRTVRRCQ